jgi:hypothetical protein
MQSGLGDNNDKNDDDDSDQGQGDDTGMEEIEHDLEQDVGEPARGGRSVEIRT